MTSQKVKSIVGCNEIDSLRNYDFPAILKERVPDTESHAKVKEVSFLHMHYMYLMRSSQ